MGVFGLFFFMVGYARARKVLDSNLWLVSACGKKLREQTLHQRSSRPFGRIGSGPPSASARMRIWPTSFVSFCDIQRRVWRGELDSG